MRNFSLMGLAVAALMCAVVFSSVQVNSMPIEDNKDDKTNTIADSRSDEDSAAVSSDEPSNESADDLSVTGFNDEEDEDDDADDEDWVEAAFDDNYDGLIGAVDDCDGEGCGDTDDDSASSASTSADDDDDYDEVDEIDDDEDGDSDSDEAGSYATGGPDEMSSGFVSGAELEDYFDGDDDFDYLAEYNDDDEPGEVDNTPLPTLKPFRLPGGQPVKKAVSTKPKTTKKAATAKPKTSTKKSSKKKKSKKKSSKKSSKKSVKK